MIVLTAKYQCKAGMGDTVEQALREMISLVKEEKGCIHYLVNRSKDEPETFYCLSSTKTNKHFQATQKRLTLRGLF